LLEFSSQFRDILDDKQPHFFLLYIPIITVCLIWLVRSRI
jgi:hypothetical protein